MKTGEIIKAALEERGVTGTALASMMGYTSTGAVSNMIKRDKLDTDVLVEVLDKLGFEVVIQPKTQGQRKAGSMVLEASGKERIKRRGGDK